ncbi:MAG TPA: glycosyltransferase [Thermoanaerobaculia bacterium]|jgi:hypothetical protein|nr:glycosyltransferase [Thermoanaerobaculia bacterium]
MRILVGYHHYRHPTDVRASYERWLARLREAGIHAYGVSLAPEPAGRRLDWPIIEEHWRRGDRALLRMYEEVARQAEDFDVFLNYNGTSLHPDFVAQLPTFNVYACWDDPESSALLSRPVAFAYDLCMVGNVAEVARYREWGARAARFWPMGFHADDYDPSLTRDQILGGERDVDIALLAERKSKFRRQRLDAFVAAFPAAHCFGLGWPRGFLAEAERVPLFQRTKVGPNFHNSTGPINLRTYSLPANGVLQVCDNRAHLGEIFRVGEEVVGFDRVDEAIDLCRYYLAHDDERRRIALAGWQRALRDYNEVAVFGRLIDAVREIGAQTKAPTQGASLLLANQRRRTFWQRLRYRATSPFRLVAGRARPFARSAQRRLSSGWPRLERRKK